METVAVGEPRRDVAGLPLPPFDPARQPLLLGLGGAMAPDDPEADPIARLTDAVSGMDRVDIMTAAFRDELVATAYREGAAEYAARLTHLPPAQRREWGARGMLSELAVALRIPEQTLARRLARHAALAAFPRFREANAAGLVSSWHCDVMLDLFGAVSDEAALAAADEALIGVALTSTPSELRAPARRWRARHMPRTEEERRRNVADRGVDLMPADDDLCLLTALLPAVQAMAIYHRLDDVAAAAQRNGDGRTKAQLRADAMCEYLLADGPGDVAFAGDESEAVLDGTASAAGEAASAAGRAASAAGKAAAVAGEAAAVAGEAASTAGQTTAGASPQMAAAGGSVARAVGCSPRPPAWVYGIAPVVVLTVPVLSLLGRGDEPADLEGFGPIDIETATRLAAQAPSFIRVLTHPETGAVLSVGRDRYRVPADLKAALAVRDETCRFPGCRRRAVRCDVDHSLAWERGGDTCLDNLAHLCRKHHRLKHQLGWAVAHEGGGALAWTSPAGSSYRTEPARQVWPRRPSPRPRPPEPTAPAADGPPPRATEPEITSGYADEPPF